MNSETLFSPRVLGLKRFNMENSSGITRQKKAGLNYVNSTGFVELKSAFNRKIVWYYRKNMEGVTNYPDFLDTSKSELVEKLREFSEKNPIKYNLKLEATYNVPNVENSSQNRAFKTSAKELFLIGDIEGMVSGDLRKLIAEEEE